MHRTGDVEECDGAAGRRLLEAEPLLVAYGAALVASGADLVRFFWHRADQGWMRVRIERATASAQTPSALVTIVRDSLPFGLTDRELDVLTLLAGGLHNREIAERLRASARTVSTHVEHILMKLGQRSRTGAAAMAVDRGLLHLPIPSGGLGMEALSIGTIERLVHGREEEDRAASPVLRRRPFLLGSAVPLSGPAWSDGLEMRNGASLAIDEVNSRGGIAGRRIELVVADAEMFSPEGIREAFEELAEAEVDAITMGYMLTEGDDLLDVAVEYGSPILHAITSEEQLRLVREDPGRYRRVFQVCPSEVHYGRGFARFLQEVTASGRWSPRRRTVEIVETPVEGGQMSTRHTLEAVERAGWSVALVERVPELGADWATVASRLREAEVGAVLIADYLPGELAGFQRAFASEPIESLVYAVYTPSIPEFLTLAGRAADGIVWSTVTGTYSDPLGSRFAGRFAQAFGRPPGRSHAGIAYDEVHLLAHAWAEVGNPRDFEAVAQHLRRGAHRGVNGAYFFDEDQSALAYPDMTLDPSLGQAHLVLQVRHARHRILGPPPYTEASFERPSWWPARALA
ncbi:MAG: ABC transporter substrate-binding protein [Actinobacteria bacterium]|nr:ABC transporter substrate-binding protein [Actinomycetota bacterium]